MAAESTTGDETATEQIERTDIGASIEATITRGTGTRDQEKWRLKGKGADAEQALAEFEAMLERVEAEYGDRVRGFQPDRDGEEAEAER